jgi:hypothetical protein
MSTSITPSGTIASVSKALVLASRGDFNEHVSVQAQCLQSAAVAYIDDVIPDAQEYDILTLTTKITNKLLADNKAMFISQYPDLQKDYTFSPPLSVDEVDELSNGISLDGDGLRYLVKATNTVLHGQTPKMITSEGSAGHPALGVFKQGIPQLLHKIEALPFSAEDLSMARVGDDMMRVRSGGDDYYEMQEGLSTFLSTFEKETKHAIYYGNETLMHIIHAARTEQSLTLPEYDDAPRHKIKMKSIHHWSPNGYNVMSDIPAPDQDAMDRLNTVLMQTNELIQKKPDAHFKRADGDTMPADSVAKFKGNFQSFAIEHLAQSQSNKYKYSADIGYPASKKQLEGLDVRSVSLLVAGRSHRLQPLLDMKLDVSKKEIVDLIQDANRSKSTVTFKDSKKNRQGLNSLELDFAKITVSPDELSDLNKRYVKVTPFKQFLMDNVLIDLKKEYGNLLGVSSEFEPEQLAIILSERWSKVTGLPQDHIRSLLSEKVLTDDMQRDADITTHLYHHLSPLEQKFLDGESESLSIENVVHAPQNHEDTLKVSNRRS